jgi:hypothetical protein
VRNRFPFILWHTHHGPLDSEQLICQPSLVRHIELPSEALLIGPDTGQMDQANSQRDDKNHPNSEAIKAPPPSD